MQRLLSFLCAVLLSAGLFSQAHAQENRLYINGGLSIPLSDFADDGDFDEGHAGVGLAVTGDYLVPLGSPGLDWATSASITANTVEEEFFGVNDADVGYWFNLPVLTGIRYQTDVSPTVDLFGLGQIGLNLVRAPGVDTDNQEASPGIATSLGFGFGGGLILNDRIQISLRYLTLGEPEIEYDLETDGGQDQEFEREVPITILQLTVGIPLGGN